MKYNVTNQTWTKIKLNSGPYALFSQSDSGFFISFNEKTSASQKTEDDVYFVTSYITGNLKSSVFAYILSDKATASIAYDPSIQGGMGSGKIVAGNGSVGGKVYNFNSPLKEIAGENIILSLDNTSGLKILVDKLSFDLEGNKTFITFKSEVNQKITDLNNKIGNTNLNTTAQNISEAINELKVGQVTLSFTDPFEVISNNVSLKLNTDLKIENKKLTLDLTKNQDFNNLSIKVVETEKAASFTQLGRVKPFQTHFLIDATGELQLDLKQSSVLSQTFAPKSIESIVNQNITNIQTNIDKINILEDYKTSSNNKISSLEQFQTQAQPLLNKISGLEQGLDGSIKISSVTAQTINSDLIMGSGKNLSINDATLDSHAVNKRVLDSSINPINLKIDQHTNKITLLEESDRRINSSINELSQFKSSAEQLLNNLNTNTVKTSGNQSISGTKTFQNGMIVSGGNIEMTSTASDFLLRFNVDQRSSGSDLIRVHKAGTRWAFSTIFSGGDFQAIKFTGATRVNDPRDVEDIANKRYVDNKFEPLNNIVSGHTQSISNLSQFKETTSITLNDLNTFKNNASTQIEVLERFKNESQPKINQIDGIRQDLNNSVKLSSITTQTIDSDIALGSGKNLIVNTPTETNHAANKAYVDTKATVIEVANLKQKVLTNESSINELNRKDTQIEASINSLTQATERLEQEKATIVSVTNVDRKADEIRADLNSLKSGALVRIGEIQKTAQEVRVDKVNILNVFVQEKKQRLPKSGDIIWTTDQFIFSFYINEQNVEEWDDGFQNANQVATTQISGTIKLSTEAGHIGASINGTAKLVGFETLASNTSVDSKVNEKLQESKSYTDSEIVKAKALITANNLKIDEVIAVNTTQTQDIENLKSFQTTAEANIQTNANNIRTLEEFKNSTTVKLNELTNNDTIINRTLTSLNEFKSIAEPDIANLKSKDQEHDRLINELNQFKNTNDPIITSLNQFRNTAENKFTQLETADIESNRRIDEINNWKTTAINQVTELEQFKTSATERLNDLNNFKTSATSRLDTLEGQVNSDGGQNLLVFQSPLTKSGQNVSILLEQTSGLFEQNGKLNFNPLNNTVLNGKLNLIQTNTDKITTLEQFKTTTETKLQQLETTDTETGAKVTELENFKNSASADITSLTSTVQQHTTEAQQKFTDIEGQQRTFGTDIEALKKLDPSVKKSNFLVSELPSKSNLLLNLTPYTIKGGVPVNGSNLDVSSVIPVNQEIFRLFYDNTNSNQSSLGSTTGFNDTNRGYSTTEGFWWIGKNPRYNLIDISSFNITAQTGFTFEIEFICNENPVSSNYTTIFDLSTKQTISTNLENPDHKQNYNIRAEFTPSNDVIPYGASGHFTTTDGNLGANTVGQKMNMIITLNGTEVKGYRDYTLTYTATVNNFTEVFKWILLNRGAISGLKYANMKIFKMRLWRGALSAEQIKMLSTANLGIHEAVQAPISVAHPLLKQGNEVSFNFNSTNTGLFLDSNALSLNLENNTSFSNLKTSFEGLQQSNTTLSNRIDTLEAKKVFMQIATFTKTEAEANAFAKLNEFVQQNTTPSRQPQIGDEIITSDNFRFVFAKRSPTENTWIVEASQAPQVATTERLGIVKFGSLPGEVSDKGDGTMVVLSFADLKQTVDTHSQSLQTLTSDLGNKASQEELNQAKQSILGNTQSVQTMQSAVEALQQANTATNQTVSELNNQAVKTSGNQTIAGTKTFQNGMIVSGGNIEITSTANDYLLRFNVDQRSSGSDLIRVHKAGTRWAFSTVFSGNDFQAIKFTGPTRVNDPRDVEDIANKRYVDSKFTEVNNSLAQTNQSVGALNSLAPLIPQILYSYTTIPSKENLLINMTPEVIKRGAPKTGYELDINSVVPSITPSLLNLQYNANQNQQNFGVTTGFNDGNRGYSTTDGFWWIGKNPRINYIDISSFNLTQSSGLTFEIVFERVGNISEVYTTIAGLSTLSLNALGTAQNGATHKDLQNIRAEWAGEFIALYDNRGSNLVNDTQSVNANKGFGNCPDQTKISIVFVINGTIITCYRDYVSKGNGTINVYSDVYKSIFLNRGSNSNTFANMKIHKLRLWKGALNLNQITLLQNL